LWFMLPSTPINLGAPKWEPSKQSQGAQRGAAGDGCPLPGTALDRD
jgi:hypothetical protein